MSEDYPTQQPASRGPSRRGPILVAAIVTLVFAGLLVAVLATREDPNGSTVPSPQPPSLSTAIPTTTVDPRAEVVRRLREVLKIRERALLSRNAVLLDEVYTSDCNCRRDGQAAIRRLLRDNVVWKGLSTTLEIRDGEKVTDGQYIVIGVLTSSSIAIESESGRLLQTIPMERALFRFALAKPKGSDEWLLGHVSPIDEG
jgi:hypothetical protein